MSEQVQMPNVEYTLLEAVFLEQCLSPGIKQISVRAWHVEIATQNEVVCNIDANRHDEISQFCQEEGFRTTW